MKKISLAFVAALGLMAFSTQPGRLIQTADNNIGGILRDTTILPSGQTNSTTPGAGTNRTDSAGTLDTKPSSVSPLQNPTPGTTPDNQTPGTSQPGTNQPGTNQPGTQTSPLNNGSTGAGQPATGTGTGTTSGSTNTTR